MKKYLKGFIGENCSIYSIFENPDKELKQRIKDFKVKEDSFMYFNQEWKVLEYDGDEVKCGYKRDIKYFKKENVEDYLKTAAGNALHKAFPIKDHFKNIFGSVYHVQKDQKSNYFALRVFDLTNKNEKGEQIQPFELGTGVTFYNGFYNYHVYDWGGDIEMTVRYNYGESVHIYFNEEGDILNREYNEKFSEYECIKDNPIYPIEVLNHFKSIILNLGKLEYSQKGNKYFNDQFCYQLDVSIDRNELKVKIEKIASNGYGGYKVYRKPLIKKPINFTEGSGQDLWNKIEQSLIDNGGIELFHKKFE